MTELAHIPVAFRDGTRLPAEVDPVAVHHELTALFAHSDDPTAAEIVDAARDPQSAMHAAFEWDPDKAAERHWEGQAFYLAGSLIDTRTRQRIYVSRYAETNNPADAGRIRINLRVLPPPSDPAAQPGTVRSIPIRTITREPRAIDVPIGMAEVVDTPPDSERALRIFRQWVSAHQHDPAILRAALRILYDSL